MTVGPFESQDRLRAKFCDALSQMYKSEVPLYGDLVALVDSINGKVATFSEDSPRVDVERHGAIRLGKPSELAILARLLKVVGMSPVGYYDLSSAGLPVHSTAFRPISSESLDCQPFRIFTSLLRPELIEDTALRARAVEIIGERNIFHLTTLRLLEKAETNGGLTSAEGSEFVHYALYTFKWQEQALVDHETYTLFHGQHPLLADIACFRGPHINHLTPRVLDINLAQERMRSVGIPSKRLIEGPPRRQCPILLRQTSFQAIREKIAFMGSLETTGHRARFGEIESRGAAVTRKGHDLYQRLMGLCPSLPDESNTAYQTRLENAFQEFPDDWEELRRQKLIYVSYKPLTTTPPPRDFDLESYIASGLVSYTPLTYEDFLPASAAGIFQSNLDSNRSLSGVSGDRAAFEVALGTSVMDYFDMYQEEEDASLELVRSYFTRAT